MKKFLRILFLLFLSFIFITISKTVEANTINSISMDIYVDKNGNASVTETWVCYANQGTESYHPYYSLGNSSITNLTVSEGETVYTTLSSWNTSGSLSDKAYKCGINRISNGVELCWGISTYGSHTYVVKYNISNFVSNLTDSQMIYWTLIPYDFSATIGRAYIKIYTDFKIEDTIDVWGFGNYGGTCYVYDGYIEMESNGSLDSSEYMTILAKFPLNTFNSTNNLNYDFEYYFTMSQEGATKYKKETDDDSFADIFSTIVSAIITLAIPFSVFTAATKSNLDFGPMGKKFSKDIPYYRDIPCNKDLLRAYYIAYEYKILSNKTDLLGAIILKWLKDGLIRVESRSSDGIFKKENAVIILNETDPNRITERYESRLFGYLFEASKDGILENKEFEKWCRKSYDEILDWFDDIIRDEKEKLVKEGIITVEKKTFGNKYHATEQLRQFANEIYGLKRYLLDYTLIPDRQAVEVALFEEYLVFAQMLGIAKTVAKQFKDLYPQLIAESHFYSYDNIMFIYAYSYSGIHAATAAQARAQSYSAGGGGFSSGGGGGGSFGRRWRRRRFPLNFINFIVFNY